MIVVIQTQMSLWWGPDREGWDIFKDVAMVDLLSTTGEQLSALHGPNLTLDMLDHMVDAGLSPDALWLLRGRVSRAGHPARITFDSFTGRTWR